MFAIELKTKYYSGNYFFSGMMKQNKGVYFSLCEGLAKTYKTHKNAAKIAQKIWDKYGKDLCKINIIEI